MKRELSKYLKSLTQEELIKEIKKLYDKLPKVKEYYELELSEDTTVIVEKYKARIKKEYFPSRGYGKARSGASRKIITEFKKIAVHPKDVVDLLLYRTEMMIQFTSEYGDIDEPFYNSLESSFEEACKLIEKERLQKYYRHYCQELVSETFGFGWGLHDGLHSIYQEYLDYEV